MVPRYYVVDGQDSVVDPVGMYGSRLDVETHVVTASASAMQNLVQCVEGAGVRVDSLILEPLAAAEAVVQEEELRHGVALVNIGGGTTDVAVFVNGAVTHTAVLPIGGVHMTRDLVVALRVPQPSAELAKRQFGHAIPSMVDPDELVEIDSFGSEGRREVSRRLIAQVLQARTEELFELVHAEIRRGSQAETLAAGVVLTGGAALLPGLDLLAEGVLQLPARIGRPRHLAGLSDILQEPAYATSVGLLRWALKEREVVFRSRGAARAQPRGADEEGRAPDATGAACNEIPSSRRQGQPEGDPHGRAGWARERRLGPGSVFDYLAAARRLAAAERSEWGDRGRRATSRVRAAAGARGVAPGAADASGTRAHRDVR